MNTTLSKRKRRFSEDDIRNMVKAKNHSFVSFRREKTKSGSKTFVTSVCPFGHELEVRLDQFENRECKDCAKKTRSKKQSLDSGFVKEYLSNHGYTLLNDYRNSKVKIKVVCPEGHISEVWWSSFRNGHRCLTCFNVSQSGSKSVNWNGGYRKLNEYIRKKINPWKIESAKSCSYKCVITNVNFDVIHHLVGFNLILDEAMKELEYPVYDKLSDYTDSELNSIVEKVLEVHFRYPLGVCLSKEVHEEFHLIYGKGDNTPEQFYEFKEKYINKKDGVAV